MNAVVNLKDLKRLNGKTVLIKSADDRHQPPAGIRGTIELVPGHPPGATARVRLVWEIPDMFNAAAHRRTVTLADEESVRRLLASERDGTFEFTLAQELD